MTFNNGQKIVDCGQWIVDRGQGTVDSRQRTADSEQQTADSGQQPVDSGMLMFWYFYFIVPENFWYTINNIITIWMVVFA